MTELRILSARDVEQLLKPAPLEDALVEALVALSAGRADVPPRSGTQTADGVLLTMPGHVAGQGLAAKLISIFPGNVDVPSHQGLIVLFDDSTGTPVAVLDAEVISVARTAITARIAADRLARGDAEVLTIVGAGAQAVGHATAFADLRPWAEVRAVNRSQPAAVRVAGAAREAGAARAVVVEDLRSAIAGADVVALCTHADAPVAQAAWFDPGCHVSSVGSRAELDPALLGPDTPVVVEWRGAVTNPPPAGAAELQHLDADGVVELGQLLAGTVGGRGDDDQITVYKSTGHAVEDVAAAALVYRLAGEQGIGAVVEL